MTTVGETPKAVVPVAPKTILPWNIPLYTVQFEAEMLEAGNRSDTKIQIHLNTT